MPTTTSEQPAEAPPPAGGSPATRPPSKTKAAAGYAAEPQALAPAIAEPNGSGKSPETAVLRTGVPAACASFQALDLHPDYQLYDVDFFECDNMQSSLQNYYDFCLDHTMSLSVTTSCFTVWRKAKKTNGAGKIIPAVKNDSRGENTRIFFFDDNINLHLGGSFETEGLCNLRDINTGEFVDFSVGKNGFRVDRVFRHTDVQSSSEYKNVLIQANMLDAMTNPDYFSDIIDRYTKPGERVIAFVDINCTIIAFDTVANKDVAQTLMTSMFRFSEVRPRAGEPASLEWPGKAAVTIEKREDLKSLVHRLAAGDDDFYRSFWTYPTLEKFVHAVASVGDLGWEKTDGLLEPADIMSDMKKNIEVVKNSPMTDGITTSWFRCYSNLVKGGHQIILNSFGVDTTTVLRHIAPETKEIVQLTVNYKMWSEKDVNLWKNQFSE